MDVVYERGSREAPKGHALIYFRSSSDRDEVWVTYAVILPISVDVSKYVPPFLMNQLGDVGPKEMSAFAFPPAPEKLSGYGQIENLPLGDREREVFHLVRQDPFVLGIVMAPSTSRPNHQHRMVHRLEMRERMADLGKGAEANSKGG